MLGAVAAPGLLLVNVAIIAAVFLLSETPRRSGRSPPAPDECYVCSAADPASNVRGVPVCPECEDEYFGDLR